MCKACNAGSHNVLVMFPFLWGFCLFHINHSACLGTVGAQTVITFFFPVLQTLSSKICLSSAQDHLLFVLHQMTGRKKQFTALIKAFLALISSSIHTHTHTLTRAHTYKAVIYQIIHRAAAYKLGFF